MNARTLRGPLLVALAASLWGGWSLAIKPAERAAPNGLPAAFEAFAILLGTTVMLAPLVWFEKRRGGLKPVDGGTWRLIAALGVSDAANALLFFLAMQTTTVAVAVVTHYLAPIFVALLAPILLREAMTRSSLTSLVVAMGGLWLLLRPWEADSTALGGALWGALSAVFFAANVFLGKSLGTRLSVGQLSVLPKLVTVPALAIFVPWSSLEVGAPSLAMLLAGTAVFGALPLVLFYRGFARTRASQASVLTLCEPLVAVLVGTFVWQEPLSVLGVVGGALVLGGALASLRAPRAQRA